MSSKGAIGHNLKLALYFLEMMVNSKKKVLCVFKGDFITYTRNIENFRNSGGHKQ